MKTARRAGLSARIAVLLAVACAGPAAAANNRALLIGISQYADPEMNDLAYADEDVKTFGSILRGLTDYRPSDIQVLLNKDATKKSITDAIVALVKESQKNPVDHFLIMYAGHGLPANIASNKTNAFLAPHDAYLNQFFPEGAGSLLGNETFINKAWLIRQLSAMNAKNIVIILDSCYSGAKDFGELYADNLGFKTEFEAGGGDRRGIVVVRKKGGDRALDRRIAFLASSRENQPSAEYKELRHGALSYTMFQYLDSIRNSTDEGESADVTVDGMFDGIAKLFDTVQVTGGSLSRVHQPVLVPLPDFEDVKGMRFMSLRGLRPKAAAPAVAAAPEPPATGELYVDTGEDECEISVDNAAERYSSNKPLALGEGRHLVSLYLPGTNYNTTLFADVKAGQRRKVDVALRGRLDVESYAAGAFESAPALDVYLDGRSVGRTGLRLKSVLAGTHTLLVTARDVNRSRQIEIRPESPLLVRYKVVVERAKPARRDESGADDVTF